MNKKKTLKKEVIHYAVFFGLYFVTLYLLLYASNDLSPFQVNFHFFSNAVGSISKRYLGDILPYVLLFILMYHARSSLLKFILLFLFYASFSLNILAMGYFFLNKANGQLYVLEGFQWPLFFSFFTPFITFVALVWLCLSLYFMVFVFHSSKQKGVFFSGQKKTIAYGLLTLAMLVTYVIPSRYDLHETVYTSDHIQKKTVKLMDLDKSGLELLADDLLFFFGPQRVEAQDLSDPELGTIESLGLDTKNTQVFTHPPKKIVLIVVESLNQSFISHYNPEIAGTTPFLDSLLEEYPTVDDFYPSGPFTIHGLNAMLCGHTNVHYGTKYPEHECMPKILADDGYETEMIRGFSKYYVGENLVFNKIGFQTITAREELSSKYPDFENEYPYLYKTWGFTDNFLFDEVLDRLRNAGDDDKLFLTMLTVDTHMPGGRCYDRDRDLGNSLILYSVSCFDDNLRDFVTSLKAEGLLDQDTLVFLTSDQLYPAFSSIPGDHFQTSFKLRPARIPFLMISGQALELKAKSGSQVDIASTILDLTNELEPDYYMGRSLLSNAETFPTGEDRANGYIIIGNKFYATTTKHEAAPEQNTDGPIGFGVKAGAGTVEELETYVQFMKDVRSSALVTDDLIQKWYYNHYFVHDLAGI